MATNLLRMISSGPLPGPACGCSRCRFFVGNEPVRTGCNTDSSCCGCARSGSGSTGRWSYAFRCGCRVHIVADVNRTFTFDDIEVGPDRWPQGLPRLVPMVDAAPAVAEVDPLCQWPASALGLPRVFMARTGRIRPSWVGRMAAEPLGLGEGQLAVRAPYGEDPLVEGFWSRCRTGGLIDQVAAQEWDPVPGLNFSKYGNQPRFEHLLNFRRSLMIVPEVAGVGVPVVPNLYWFRLENLNRYLSWNGDAAPAAIAVTAQTFRTEADWANMLLPRLTWLASGLDDLGVLTRVMMCGASRGATPRPAGHPRRLAADRGDPEPHPARPSRGGDDRRNGRPRRFPRCLRTSRCHCAQPLDRLAGGRAAWRAER